MSWNLADAARRYEAGESLAHIAQALDTPETTVYRRLLAGGLPPRETAPWGARRHGTRNYARERARHSALAPEKQRAVYDLLHSQLPDKELALVGRDRILAWLHSLGLRRPNGGPVSWHQVLRWTRHHGFPLLHGSLLYVSRAPRCRTPSLTTTYAITAWILSRFDSGQNDLFRVYSRQDPNALREVPPRFPCHRTVAVDMEAWGCRGSERLSRPEPRRCPLLSADC
jgi:hypothetical protein